MRTGEDQSAAPAVGAAPELGGAVSFAAQLEGKMDAIASDPSRALPSIVASVCVCACVLCTCVLHASINFRSYRDTRTNVGSFDVSSIMYFVCLLLLTHLLCLPFSLPPCFSLSPSLSHSLTPSLFLSFSHSLSLHTRNSC